MRRALIAFSGAIILITPIPSLAGSCGDVDNSGSINILDITYLLRYLYKSGSEPNCGTSYAGLCGDVNNNGFINILDAAYLINHIYKGGPGPYCGGTGIVTDIDGNIYKTIKIGDQWWMAENLKVTHYRDNSPIPNVTDLHIWENLVTGAYCEYDNDPENGEIYGSLYNWYAVADIREIAPEGWHVSTASEWNVLRDYLGGSQVAGGKLKDTGTAYWCEPNEGATNESGFTGLPGGFRMSSGGYDNMCIWAMFWSSTYSDGNGVMWECLYSSEPSLGSGYYDMNGGMSVRCVEDAED
nr:hypothetical protein [candidate division Zixibacteria bacterium]